MELNLLIVGRTGEGKSATGNCILGNKKCFVAKMSAQSVTKAVSKGQEMFGTYRITVVDTIGYADTDIKDRNFKYDSYILMKTQIEQALKECPAGFHAIIYVTNSSSRITQEHMNAFECITSVMGKENFKKFGILLFTFGSEYIMQHGNLQFVEWCKNQHKLKPFLDQCDNRVILFENKTNDTFNTQRSDLVNIIKTIMSNNCDTTYTTSHFKEAVKDRKYFDVEGKKESVENDVEMFCKEIDMKLKDIQTKGNQNKENKLTELSTSLAKYIRETTEQDQQTHILESCFEKLTLLKVKVDNDLLDLRRKFKYSKDEEKRKIIEDRKRLLNSMRLRMIKSEISNAHLREKELTKVLKMQRREKRLAEVKNIAENAYDVCINIAMIVINFFQR